MRGISNGAGLAGGSGVEPKKKKKKKKKLKVSEPWGIRVDAMIRAKGWRRKDMLRHWGVEPRTIDGIRYHGRRPSTELVVLLRKLEEVYASDLVDLASGLMEFRGTRWIDWRIHAELSGDRSQRPEDLQALG